jgi:DNA-binding beta-propeller fold protein YncE
MKVNIMLVKFWCAQFLVVACLSLWICPVQAEQIVLVAGGAEDRNPIDATQALLKEPFGTAFDAGNNLWIIEMTSGNRLLKIDSAGVLKHFAGRPENGSGGDGGPALEAQFNGPHNLALHPDGRILIADTWNGRIRQVDPRSGIVDSLPGFNVPIESAKSQGPYCITLDFEGRYLYIANLKQILRLEVSSGKLSVFAGNGKKGIPRDGTLAIDAPLVDPRAVAPDRLGNVYILERGGHALRVVKKDGSIYTVVNAQGVKGTMLGLTKTGAASQGESKSDAATSSLVEPALTAMMNGPKHLCVDQVNRVVIADAENHLVRLYDPNEQTLRRIAGTGQAGAEGIGGDPLQCQLARPHGVTIHPQTGKLYITDSYNNRILRIE